MSDVKRFVWTLGPDGNGGSEWGVSGPLPNLKENYPLVMVLESDYKHIEEENDQLKREIAQLRESIFQERFIS